MGKSHKHRDLIRAWADGAEVQCKSTEGDWINCDWTPSWDSDDEYRIKPEEPDIEKYGVEVGDVWYIPYFKKYHTVWNIVTNDSYSGGKLIKTLDESKISYGMLIENKCKLVFRKGVVNLL